MQKAAGADPVLRSPSDSVSLSLLPVCLMYFWGHPFLSSLPLRGGVCMCICVRQRERVCNSWSWRAHLFKHCRELVKISPTILSAWTDRCSHPQSPIVLMPEVLWLLRTAHISYAESSDVQTLCDPLWLTVKIDRISRVLKSIVQLPQNIPLHSCMKRGHSGTCPEESSTHCKGPVKSCNSSSRRFFGHC